MTGITAYLLLVFLIGAAAGIIGAVFTYRRMMELMRPALRRGMASSDGIGLVFESVQQSVEYWLSRRGFYRCVMMASFFIAFSIFVALIGWNEHRSESEIGRYVTPYPNMKLTSAPIAAGAVGANIWMFESADSPGDILAFYGGADPSHIAGWQARYEDNPGFANIELRRDDASVTITAVEEVHRTGNRTIITYEVIPNRRKSR